MDLIINFWVSVRSHKTEKETNIISTTEQRKIKQTDGPENTDELIWIETGTGLHSRQGFVLQMMRIMDSCSCNVLFNYVCLYLSHSADSFYDTFHTTADMMYFCQMMAVLEVINPLLGLVKTGFFPAMIQVIQGGQSLLIVMWFQHKRWKHCPGMMC